MGRIDDQMQRAMNGVKSIIELCGDDPNRDGLQETPKRVSKAFLEHTRGYKENPKDHLDKQFDVEHQELVMVKAIDFQSLCEHHFALFRGKAYIGYIPNEKITGLSKFARLVDGYAKRFQVQERLTTQIANAIDEVLEPKGVMVVVDAEHTCMCARGVMKPNATTTTSAVRGVFQDEAHARNEFLQLMRMES